MDKETKTPPDLSILDDVVECMQRDGPKVLVMGKSTAGKSSLLRVVFKHRPGHETIWVPKTEVPEFEHVNNTELLDVTMIDFPGGLTWEEKEMDALIFAKAPAILLVIDAQDEPYDAALQYCVSVIQKAWSVNRDVLIEVFIHKMDGDLFVMEQHKEECQRDITSKLEDELIERNVAAQMTVYSTSVFDHSIYEAMSKVLQKMVPSLGAVETLLDHLTTTCRFDRVFLFDVVSKCYLAADTAAFDHQIYEAFSDLLDVVIDITCIYSKTYPNPRYKGLEGLETLESLAKKPEPVACGALCSSMAQLQLPGSESHYLLYLKHLDKYLTLVAVVREEVFDRQHLVDHNVSVFNDALKKLMALKKPRNASATSNIKKSV
eukprot:Platyproteum_vivax@DN3055_c0_g1_i1.p1